MINSDVTIIDEVQSDSGSKEGTYTFEKGAAIGDYTIDFVLADGAQAKVYVVTLDDKKYVAKVYGRNWQPNKTLRDFFVKNHHENIMKVIGSGRELGMYYEVYPYYELGTLSDHVKENGNLSADFIRQS